MYMAISRFAHKRKHLSLILAAFCVLSALVALADIASNEFSTAASTNVTIINVQINKPSNVSQNDILVADVVVNGGDAATITAPSGWTLIRRTDNDTNTAMASYYKVAGSSEPSSYTWSIDSQTRAEGGITRYSGVDMSNPVDTSAGNFGRGTTATTSAITTASNNEGVIALYGFDVGNSGNYFSAPSGMTEKYDVSNSPLGPSTAADDALQTSAGSTGSKTSTISGGKARNWVSQIIALNKPTATVPSINGSITTQTVDGIATTSVVFSHTVAAGNNHVLIVTMGSNNSVDSSATYDGITMTQGVTHGFGSEEAYGYWYLVNPPQGTHDIVITFPNNTNYRQYAAITFQNVDQTTPFDTDTHVGGNGGNPSASVTTTEDNELVLYFLDYDDRSTNLVYTPNDSSLYWVNNDSTGSTFGNQGAAHTQTSAGTVSVGGSGGGGGGPWDLVAVPIRPAN
jgi:hypothetical protein